MSDTSIPCKVAMKRLWAFIDGELDAVSEDEMRRHIEMCPRCYPRYDFQLAYFSLMQRLASQPEPPDLRSRIFHALLAEAA